MLKEEDYPQVKAIGNCICEVLTRKQQTYRDIALLSELLKEIMLRSKIVAVMNVT